MPERHADFETGWKGEVMKSMLKKVVLGAGWWLELWDWARLKPRQSAFESWWADRLLIFPLAPEMDLSGSPDTITAELGFRAPGALRG